MNQFDTKPMSDQQKEQLKKEQKSIRKAGIILLVLAVIIMPIVSAIHYALVGVSGILATIGGFMTARSYIHVKYQNLDKQK